MSASGHGLASRLPLLLNTDLPQDSVDEYVEIEADNSNPFPTELLDDGDELVTLEDGDEDAGANRGAEGSFYENLACFLPESVMMRIVSDLLQKVEQDKTAREERDKQYEEGIRRTGLGKDAPGGAQFEGASRAVHPMITEACVDYEAHVIKELWPVGGDGPVKPNILGKPTRDKAEKAKRKTDFLNYQLKTQITEARTVLETTLIQSPLGGAGFIKLWWDHRLDRPRLQFAPIDKMYLPANAASYHSSIRRTFSDTISDVESKQRMESGQYRTVALGSVAMTPDQSKAEKANDKIEGVSRDNGLNIDGDREIYETMAYLEVTQEMADCLDHEEPGKLYPYLITFDVQTKKVLSFYRDWEESDPARVPIDHFFEFPFIVWRGAYPIGLPHMIGGLSSAATGSLRALLDSAMIANMQGGLILKGSGTSGQTKRAEPGEFAEIEGGVGADDIRKRVMQFNTKEPSTVLFQLLGFVVDAAKSVVRTTLDDQATDAGTPVPVGTQMSRVEQGLVVFSAIHGRNHEAFNRLLAGLHRLNRMYLPEAITIDTDGDELFVMRQDFEGPTDVQPVSDPTVYSDLQRQAQVAGLEQSALAMPGLYDLREVEKWKLELWKIPDPDRFLTPKPQPEELNAINENAAMCFGRPVTAFPDQDHLAHIQAHLDFMRTPILGMNPLIAPKFLPPALQHVTEHIVYHYVKTTSDLVSGAAQMPATALMDSEDPQIKGLFDQLLALASQTVVQMVGEDFARVAPVLQQAQQMLAALAPPTPVDPAKAAADAAAAETGRKAQNDKTTADLKGQGMAVDAQNKAAMAEIQRERNQVMADRNDIDAENSARDAAVRVHDTVVAADAAKDIAMLRLGSGQKPTMKDGASLNQGA